MARRMSVAQASVLLLLCLIFGIISSIILAAQFLVDSLGIENILTIFAACLLLFVIYKTIRYFQKQHFAENKLEEWSKLTLNTLKPLSSVGLRLEEKEKIVFNEPFIMFEGNLKAEHRGELILTTKRIIFKSLSTFIMINACDIISAQTTNISLVIGKKGKKRQYYFCTKNNVRLAKAVAYFAILSEGNIDRISDNLYKLLTK